MLANGDIAAQYGMLAGGFTGTDQTVDLMRKMSQGQYGSRSPKIRALAINIVSDARIPEKDEYREMVAIHNWVRDNIRYQKDVYGQETLSYPEETAFNSQAGDCDDKSMLEAALLSSIGIPTRFKTIGVTPVQFSHVYLEAKPRGHGWIPLDPIMKNKPAGWEVPKGKQKLVKTYAENRPTGDDTMNGMGYVGEPDHGSHLGPASGGTQTPYVRMQSFLDTDAPVDQISQDLPANHPNANIPQQFPRDRMRAHRRDPILHRPTKQMPDASNGPIENDTLRPAFDGLYTPDALAGLGAANNNSAVESVMNAGPDNGREGADIVSMPKQAKAQAYMQSKTTSHAPQGADEMFLRPNLVHRDQGRDKIEYTGHPDLSEQPRIYPVTGVAGYAQAGDPLPGMGYLGQNMVGPGLAPTGTEAAVAPESAEQAAPQTPYLRYVGYALVGWGLYRLFTN